MQLRSLVAAALLLAAPTFAWADPTGTFKVQGKSPDSGKDYVGSVTVERTGETYKVTWKIGNSEYAGTGLGAKFVGNRFEMGPASPDDTAISVGYISGKTFGMAMYFQQPDGTWQGVWTYAGTTKAAPENWTAQ
jgi:hypothetical protein